MYRFILHDFIWCWFSQPCFYDHDVSHEVKSKCFTHPESESKQLQQHLHSEESSKHHVEDVHDVAEGFRLFIVLQKTQTQSDTHTGGIWTWMTVWLREGWDLPEQPEWRCWAGSGRTWHTQSLWSWWWTRTCTELDSWGCKVSEAEPSERIPHTDAAIHTHTHTSGY